MSKRYLVLARVRDTLQFFSLTSNAHPASVGREASRMLKLKYGRQPVELLLTSDLKPWISSSSPMTR
jgi:hypothetical protein